MDRQERAELLRRLQNDAERIAGHFGLEYRDIAAEHPRVKSRYGVCYQDGLIKIRLNHAKTGQPLKYSSLIDTLCHELAHLRHFDHGPEFKEFFFKLLGWARRQGIYQPGPARGGRRSPGRPALARAPLPVEGGPPRRNGVAVFPSGEPELCLGLPWLSAGSPPAPEPSPASNQKKPPAPRPRRSRQLSLF
jgi:hypothetical protein